MTADPHIRGYYLSADVAHDFGTPVLNTMPYNHGGPDANAKITPKPAKPPKIDEDSAVAFIENEAKNMNGTEFVPNGKARREKRIIFTIPSKTQAFKVGAIPRLFEVGNDKIGIVQDAGKFITTTLGAKNVITFGSILDPAGKPIDPADRPIWYSPAGAAKVTIPLGAFGFDTGKIQSITVTGLTAGTVKSTFQLGPEFGNKVYDAVGMVPYKDDKSLKAKPINNTEIETAGFYTSIAKAQTIDLNPAAKEVRKAKLDRLFNIGKTLGDLALVASAMPTFADGTSNPYSGIGQGKATSRQAPGWRDWLNGEGVDPPQILVLKTGDRLNALRAQMERVPCILEQQTSKERAVKQFVFTPGIASPESIANAVIAGYDQLINNVTARYNTLIFRFNECLTPTKTLKPGYSVFTETPELPDTDTAGLAAAGALIDAIANHYLKQLQASLVQWLTSRKPTPAVKAQMIRTPKTLETIQTQYNSDVETCTRVAPQTLDVVYEKGGVKKIVLKIIVAQVPKVIPKEYTCPIKVSLDISLWNAFRKLKRATGLGGLVGTDIYTRFLAPVTPLVPPPASLTSILTGALKGGAPPSADEDALLSEFAAYANVKAPETQTGGDRIKITYADLEANYFPDGDDTLFTESFPLLAMFRSYLDTKLGIKTLNEFLVSLYDIELNLEKRTLIDEVAVDELLREVDILESEGLIAFEGGVPAKDGATTAGTAAFNAFVCNLNAQNASAFGYIGDIPEEPPETDLPQVMDATAEPGSPAERFSKLEALFLAQADVGTLRTRATTYFRRGDLESPSSVSSSPSVPSTGKRKAEDALDVEQKRLRGGLDSRRPLYPNAQSSLGSLPSEHNA